MTCHSTISLLGILSAIYLFIVTDCLQLSITPRGSQVKNLQSSVILTCTILDFDSAEYDDDLMIPMNIRWIGPDMRRIKETVGRVHVETFESKSVKLYINNLQQTDSGVYSCQMDFNGELFTEDTHLHLYEDIRFVDKPVYYKHNVGDESAMLQCTANGMPMPEISWRFNRTKLPEVSEKYLSEVDGLRIKDVQLSDNGTYECRAQVESQGNLKIRSIYLDVLYAPVIVEHPHVDQVIKGDDVILRCEAHANPPVRYEWYMEKIMTEFVKAKVPVSKGSKMFRIEKIDIEDEGRYFCRAINSLGSRESKIDITILVPPLIKDLGNKAIVEGRTLIIPCELVAGRPSPELTWYRDKDGKKLTHGAQSDDPNISIDNANRGISKLIIRNIERYHEGLYSCQAVNIVGNDSKSTFIGVEFVPRIIVTPTEVVGVTGQARNLTCIAYGQPLPIISWSSRGQNIGLFDTDSYKVIRIDEVNATKSVLQVTIGENQPWMFGDYSCLAKNLHGSAVISFHMREGELPDLPLSVNILHVTDEEATFLVTPPKKTGGIALTSWMMKYEDDVKQEKTIFYDYNPGDLVNNLTATQLKSDTEYIFYLAAGNEAGFGDFIKLKIKTHVKSIANEQSDVPQPKVDSDSGVLNDAWEKDAAALEKMRSAAGASSSSSVAVILGVISGLALLVLVSFGTVFWLRRRQLSYSGGEGGEGGWKHPFFGSSLFRGKHQSSSSSTNRECEGKEINKMQMETRRLPSIPPPPPPIDEDLPDVVIYNGVDASRSCMPPPSKLPSAAVVCGGMSPKPGRVCSPPTPMRSVSTTPNSVQRFAWDQMLLLTREMTDEDLSSGFGTAEPDLSVQSDPRLQINEFYSNQHLGLMRPAAAHGEEDEDEVDVDTIPDLLDAYHSEDNMDAEELDDDRL